MPKPIDEARFAAIMERTDEDILRIIQQLDDLLDAHGQGSRSEVIRTLGKSSSFLQDHKRKGRKGGQDLNLRKLLMILHALDCDSTHFFVRALVGNAEREFLQERLEAERIKEPYVVKLAREKAYPGE